MTDDERRDNLLLYVAGALDPAERAEVRAYLATDGVGSAGPLAEARATFAAVGLGVDPVPPSAALRRRVLDGLAPPASRRPSWARRLAVPFATGAVAAAATFALVLLRPPAFLRPTPSSPDPAVAILEQQVRQRDQTIADLQGSVGRERAVVDAVLKSSADVVRLAAQGPQPNAAAWLVWDRPAGRWVLLATHMVPSPPGRTYELWYVTTAGRKVRADTFDVAPDGSATVQTRVPADLGPLAVAAVTDEPVGGSSNPTGNFQLLAKLP